MLDNKQISITIICHKCGRYGEKNAAGPFEYGSLHIRGIGSSSPPRVAGIRGRSKNYDLCRRCTNSINQKTEADKPGTLAHWSST